jgi:hypothetical protein
MLRETNSGKEEIVFILTIQHMIAVLCGLMNYTVKRAFLFQLLKSSIPSHGMGASKNQSYNGIDLSQGIDSVESMPGLLKSLKKFNAQKEI